MNTNNFDQSSSGINLELSCFFDTASAQMYFDDNFERIDRDTPKGFYGEVFFFSSYGNDVFIENDQRNYDINCDSKTLIKKMHDFIGGDLREFMRDCEINSKDDVNIILGQFESYVGYESEYLDFLDQNFDLDFVIYQTRGHSQGDAATIIVDKKTWSDDLGQAIDHLFWDAPIYARLTVAADSQEEEVYLDESIDRYDYDKDAMIDSFKDNNKDHGHFDLIVEFLESELPNYPDYM